MIKYLITFGLAYVVYRWVVKKNKTRNIEDTGEETKEIEYSEYEELDD